MRRRVNVFSAVVLLITGLAWGAVELTEKRIGSSDQEAEKPSSTRGAGVGDGHYLSDRGTLRNVTVLRHVGWLPVREGTPAPAGGMKYTGFEVAVGEPEGEEQDGRRAGRLRATLIDQRGRRHQQRSGVDTSSCIDAGWARDHYGPERRCLTFEVPKDAKAKRLHIRFAGSSARSELEWRL